MEAGREGVGTKMHKKDVMEEILTIIERNGWEEKKYAKRK